MNLNGKTALVTGSTSGIGLGIARVLAKAGAQLILNGFGDSESAREEIAQLGKKPGYHDADLRDVLQIEAMMRYAESQFGGVDILVNNAGIQHVAPVDAFPVEKWNDIIAINLSSVFHTSRLALPAMREKTGGASSISPPFTGWSRQREVSLRCRQAWRSGLYQIAGAGNRPHRHYRQCHLPRLGADAAGATANRPAYR
jgi:NAD(P)-dependent dehydrogenase (short-subunit alcohol dehydrogenase family)